jgi:hypothetical protein
MIVLLAGYWSPATAQTAITGVGVYVDPQAPLLTDAVILIEDGRIR